MHDLYAVFQFNSTAQNRNGASKKKAVLFSSLRFRDFLTSGYQKISRHVHRCQLRAQHCMQPCWALLVCLELFDAPSYVEQYWMALRKSFIKIHPFSVMVYLFCLSTIIYENVMVKPNFFPFIYSNICSYPG